MSVLNGRGRGDLMTRILVETPTRLSKEQKAILEQFRDTETGDECPASKGFFSRIEDDARRLRRDGEPCQPRDAMRSAKHSANSMRTDCAARRSGRRGDVVKAADVATSCAIDRERQRRWSRPSPNSRSAATCASVGSEHRRLRQVERGGVRRSSGTGSASRSAMIRRSVRQRRTGLAGIEASCRALTARRRVAAVAAARSISNSVEAGQRAQLARRLLGTCAVKSVARSSRSDHRADDADRRRAGAVRRRGSASIRDGRCRSRRATSNARSPPANRHRTGARSRPSLAQQGHAIAQAWIASANRPIGCRSGRRRLAEKIASWPSHRPSHRRQLTRSHRLDWPLRLAGSAPPHATVDPHAG